MGIMSNLNKELIRILTTPKRNTDIAPPADADLRHYFDRALAPINKYVSAASGEHVSLTARQMDGLKTRAAIPGTAVRYYTPVLSMIDAVLYPEYEAMGLKLPYYTDALKAREAQ